MKCLFQILKPTIKVGIKTQGQIGRSFVRKPITPSTALRTNASVFLPSRLSSTLVQRNGRNLGRFFFNSS